MSASREDVDRIPCGADGEQVAVQLGVARHRLPVDIIAQRLGNAGRFLGQFLHIVGKAAMLAYACLLPMQGAKTV